MYTNGCLHKQYVITHIVPTAPKDLHFVDFTITGVTFSVTLTWRRPDPPNGIITQYNVSDITNNYCLT